MSWYGESLLAKISTIQASLVGGGSTLASAILTSPTSAMTVLTGSLTAVLLILKIIEKGHALWERLWGPTGTKTSRESCSGDE